MNWYKMTSNIGGDITVKDTDFWSHEFYLKEVCDNIKNNRMSRSKGEVVLVQKCLQMPNAVFIMDGHHRIIEGILNNQKMFNVYWYPNYPYIDELPLDKRNVVDFVSKYDFL